MCDCDFQYFMNNFSLVVRVDLAVEYKLVLESRASSTVHDHPQ